MIGPVFPLETSLLLFILAGSFFLAVFHFLIRLAKKNRGPDLIVLSLLFFSFYAVQFSSLWFQEDHFFLRLFEQAALVLQYAAVLRVYSVFSSMAVKQGKKKSFLDSRPAMAALLVLIAGIVFFTDLAVSGRLSYMKGLGGSVFYVTDFAFLSPVNLAVPFLIVLAGLWRYNGTKKGIAAVLRPLPIVSIFILLSGLVCQVLSLAGFLNIFLVRNAFFLGLTVSFVLWSVSLFLPALTVSGGESEEQEKEDADLYESARAQVPYLNGPFGETLAVMEEVLKAIGGLSGILMENETLFNSLFGLINDSQDNKKTLLDTIQQRDNLVSALRSESGNQSLLVPLLLNRWQGFYNEVKGITGNSSETAQFIDKLITSADKGKVLIQDHLKATNNIRLSTDKVRFIVELINDISEQTNILSINAAIEAFHAGSHGRGFSIIAEEIRQVATTTLQESNAISECIKRILDNSKAEEMLVKENESIFNDFSKSMERLFVYILNVIEVTKDLKQKMDALLGQLKLLDSGVEPVLQQEQFHLSSLLDGARQIHVFIEEVRSFSDDYFRISSLFTDLASIGEKQRNAAISAGELRRKWNALSGSKTPS